MARARAGNGSSQAKSEIIPPGLAEAHTGSHGLVLPELNLQTIELTLVGDSSLIVHRWSEKAKRQILEKQQKKAQGAKAAKDPDQDFQESVYAYDENNVRLDNWVNHKGKVQFRFPAIAFKAAAVTACTSIGGITKVQARQAFRVVGEFVTIEGSTPVLREDMVRIAMGGTDIRFRGEFSPWWATVTIQHNRNVVSTEQIANMLNTAGFGVGIGEWRPEKDGDHGCFHVANEADMKMIEQWRKENGVKN